MADKVYVVCSERVYQLSRASYKRMLESIASGTPERITKIGGKLMGEFMGDVSWMDEAGADEALEELEA